MLSATSICSTTSASQAHLTSQDTQSMSTVKKQRLRYLEAVATGTEIGLHPITYEEAHREVREHYEDRLIRESHVDISYEVAKFNECSAFKKCFFADWYAIKDYKQGGHFAINSLLRNSSDMVVDEPKINQLRLSLMQLATIEKNTLSANPILYRGETRLISEINRLSAGSILSPKGFTSASKKTLIPSFYYNGGIGRPDPNQVRIMYEIERTTLLAGPNISNILNDSDGQVIFLPGTHFEITQFDYLPNKLEFSTKTGAISIKMRTSDINSSRWNDLLDYSATLSCHSLPSSY